MILEILVALYLKDWLAPSAQEELAKRRLVELQTARAKQEPPVRHIVELFSDILFSNKLFDRMTDWWCRAEDFFRHRLTRSRS